MSALLPMRMVAKPWGRDQLPPPFAAPAGERIGEIWFEPRAPLAGLLAKYIFTSEALSVQVHPGGTNGKEECWLVIAADPGAQLAIGFRDTISKETMRAAALDGTIADLLAWHSVSPGDFFHIPPGTVHAIGAGIGLVELQQANDVTYRLFDYGRPRELHLDQGIEVALPCQHPASLRRSVPATGSARLVEKGPLRVDRIEGRPDAGLAMRYPGSVLVLPRMGTLAVAGETVAPGQCALARSLDELEVPDRAQALIASLG